MPLSWSGSSEFIKEVVSQSSQLGPAPHTNSSCSNCNMKLRRVAFGVAYLHLSFAVCVLGRSFSETAPDGSADTSIAIEENYALAESSRISSGFTPSPGLQEQHQVPIVHFRILNPVSQERRTLRDVYISPDSSGGGTGNTRRGTSGGGLSTAAIVIIVISSLSLLLFEAVLVFWCCRKKSIDPKWRLLDLFKRRNLETDEEKLYDQAKSDTDLSGY